MLRVAMAQLPPLEAPNAQFFTGGRVLATAALPDGGFIIGGDFTTVNAEPHAGVAKIKADGTLDSTWSPSIDGTVQALALDGLGHVYAGGIFTHANGAVRNSVAKLDVATGALDPVWKPSAYDVRAIAIGADGSIYLGGGFEGIGATRRDGLAKLDNARGTVDGNWNPIADNAVNALAFDSANRVYAAGRFTTINLALHMHVVRLAAGGRGSADATWQPSTDQTVNTITAGPDGFVYVGGSFTYISPSATVHPWLARFAADGDGAADLTWNPAPNSTVSALTFIGGQLYVGGGFTTMGGAPRATIARLDASGVVDASWNPAFAQGSVASIAGSPDGMRIEAGGSFRNVGSLTRFSNVTLSPLDGSVIDQRNDAERPGTVSAIATQADGGIVVGGTFAKVGNALRTNIARIRPDHTLDPDWIPNPDTAVLSLLAGADGVVYVGGYFSSIGGLARREIAKLDATGAADASWNPSIDRDGVSALAWAADGDIYAGGGFTQVNGISHPYLAKLRADGNGAPDANWIPAPDGAVSTLAVGADGAVYAGGAFQRVNALTQAGAVVRHHVAKLDGGGTGAADAAWDPSADDVVNAIALGTDGMLYIGGDFETVGGQPAPRLAKVDAAGTGSVDASWQPSPDHDVLAVVAGGDGNVYVGTEFRFNVPTAPTYLERVSAATGEVDPLWNTTDGSVNAIALGGEGVIYAGGWFTDVSGVARSSFVALPPHATDTALSITSIAPEPSQVGETYTVSFEVDAATGTPTGSVTIEDDLGSTCGPVELVDGTGRCDLASHGEGIRTLTALYESDSALFSNASTTSPHVVLKADTTVAITADAPDPSELFQTFEISAHVTGADPDGPPLDGTVAFVDSLGLDSCSVAIDAAGDATCTIFATTPGARDWVAEYSGDANYEPAESAPELHTVSRLGTSTFTLDAAGYVTEPIPYDVLVEASDSNATGTVFVGNDEAGCTAQVIGGVASCSVEYPHAGIIPVIARYSGDATHEPSEYAFAHASIRAPTTTFIRSHTPDPSVPGQAVTITADVEIEPPGHGVPIGAITISDGTDACTIAASGGSCKITMSTRGLHTLQALFPGYDDYIQSFTVANHRVNELPVAFDDNYTPNEDRSFAIDAAHGVLANDLDQDGDTLTVVNNGPQTATGIGGTVTLNADGSFSYASPANANGEAGFSYAVSDGLETASASVTLTVNAVNDPPTFALAESPSFTPGTTGAQTTPAFAAMTSAGPPDESDAPLAWHVRTVSDPDGVLTSPATIALDGTLTTPLSGHGGVATLAVALQDDGGTANGGNDTSAEQTFTVTVGAGADLSVAIDDATTFVAGGETVTYFVMVHNTGPDDATSARVQVTLSANLVDAAWSCTPSAGATCGAGGTGEIEDFPELPAGTSVVYELTATVVAEPESPAEVDAIVAVLGGATDVNPANDSAIDVDATGIFADGFDTPPADDTPKAARTR